MAAILGPAIGEDMKAIEAVLIEYRSSPFAFGRCQAWESKEAGRPMRNHTSLNMRIAVQPECHSRFIFLSLKSMA